MATQKSTLEKLGVTPIKAVLVAVLAVIFAGVLWGQFGPQDPPASKAPKTPRTRKVLPVRTNNQPAAQKPAITASMAPVVWPSMELKDVVAYDPFAVPASWRPAGSEPLAGIDVRTVDQATTPTQALQLEEKIKQLEKEGAEMVIVSGKQRLAIIGNKSLRIGDVYEGLRVIAIDSNGVTVIPDNSDQVH